MRRKVTISIAILALGMFLLIGGSVFLLKGRSPLASGEVKSFSSESDFKSYLRKSKGISTGGIMMGGAPMGGRREMGAPATGTSPDAGTEPSRVSKTNIQEEEIDEPDIVKTDGKNIYFSSKERYASSKTNVIKAYPPSELNLSSNFTETGNLLLTKDTLVVLSDSEDRVYGFDVSNPKNPQREWKIEVNGTIVDARLYKGSVYLITRERVDRDSPCPVRPLETRGSPVRVQCSDIYHPSEPVPVNVIYHTFTLDPEQGNLDESMSFVGSSSESVVYMSQNGIYITYSHHEGLVEILRSFVEDNEDLFSEEFVNRVNKLAEYDISTGAKMVEMQKILSDYKNSLSEEEEEKMENEFENRLREYLKENMRDFESTGIIKIGIDELQIKSKGEVGGVPLNQFSLDEYKGNLRIATTVGEYLDSIERDLETENDIYILDEKLNLKGSLKGLGLTQRVYSARLIDDQGYLVTYRRKDPFYVLDLSDPENPEVKGELEIPGYSSYLHPLSEDEVLGFGKESGKVKISVFDVSNPNSPEEVNKYILDEYWSDILDTHHAFLLDKKHEVFFLPGNNKGYIFSYENDISLEKVVMQEDVKRAIYLDNYLYVIGRNEISVINEETWKESLSFSLSSKTKGATYESESSSSESTYHSGPTLSFNEEKVSLDVLSSNMSWNSISIESSKVESSNVISINDFGTHWKEKNVNIGIDEGADTNESTLKKNYEKVSGEAMIFLKVEYEDGSTIEYGAGDKTMEDKLPINYNDDSIEKTIEVSDTSNIVSAELLVYGKYKE